ncbi:MAG TPA: hypothetical protein PK095_00865 [Myxococcota bacterium]|nr:hypothetical protein [Myxococcota bacterium]
MSLSRARDAKSSDAASSRQSETDLEVLETLLLEALADPEPVTAVHALLSSLSSHGPAEAELLWRLLEAHPNLSSRLRRDSETPLGRSLLLSLTRALGLRVDTSELDADTRLDLFSQAAEEELAVRGASSADEAEAILALRDELRAELGLAHEVPVSLGGLGQDLGRSGPDGVVLHERFDPWSLEGRALMAHELAHEAQRGLAGSPDLFRAESEASAIMSAVLRGQYAPTPQVALPPGVYAACGPQAMAEARAKPVEPEPEPEEDEEEEKEPRRKRDPVPPTDRTLKVEDTGGTPRRGIEVAETPTPGPTPEAPTTPEPAQPECETKCPDPLPEHLRDAPVRAPLSEAPRGNGEERTLHLAGHKIKFRLPENAKAGQVRVTFRNADSPYGAMTLKSALLTLGEDLQVKSGQLTADIRLGRFLHVPNARLTVTQKGRVALQVRGAAVQIGNIVKGKVDLNIDPSGISGAGVFLAQDIALGPRLKVKSGMLAARVSKGGAISAHGQLTIEVAGLGTVELDACFVDGELRGKVTVTLTRPIPFGLGRITRVQLSGCYDKNGWHLHGEVDLKVRDWVAGTVKADLTRDSAGKLDWSVEGVVKQVRPIEFGNLMILDATLAVKNKNGTWDPATASVHYQTPQLIGTLQGTIDLEQGKVSGTGDVEVTDRIDVGVGHLEQGHLVATVTDNELVSVMGRAKLSFDYRGQPTFELTCEQALWDVKAGELHAHGELNVLRDLVLGDAAGLHTKVPRGPAGHYVLEYGRLVHSGVALAIEVLHGETLLGKGGLSLEYNDGADLEGALEFWLIDRLGIPSVATGPLFLIPGATFSARLTNGALGPVELRGAQWELGNRQGPGKLLGTLDGAYDFDTGHGTLTGQAWVHEPWVLSTSFGELALGDDGHGGAAGEASLRVGKGGIEELSGTLGLVLGMTTGPFASTGPSRLSGTLGGRFDPEKGLVSGQATLGLSQGLTFEALGLATPPGLEGTLIPGSELRGELVDNTPTALGGELAAMLSRVGEPLAQASLDVKMDLGSGRFDAFGYAQLLADVSLSQGLGTGDTTRLSSWGLLLASGSQLGLVIDANRFVAADLQLDAWATRGEERVAHAQIAGQWLFGENDKLSGSATVTTSLPLHLTDAGRFGVWLGAGTTVSATVLDSAFSEGSGQIALLLEEGGIDYAKLSLEGTLGDEFTGLASLAVLEPIRLVERQVGQVKKTRIALNIATGSGGQVQVLDSRPIATEGELVLEVLGDEVPFARGAFVVSADFTAKESPVAATGELEVFAPLPLGQAGDFELSLAPPTRAFADLSDGLRSLDGELHLGLARAGDDVGALSVTGQYRVGETPQIDGEASVTISQGFPLYRAGAYELGLAPSSFAAVMKSGQITQIDGAFGVHLEQRGPKSEAPLGTLTLSLEGRYARALGAKVGRVDGEGSISVDGELEVAQAGDFVLRLTSGTAARVTLEDNAVKTLEGKVTGGLDIASVRSGEARRFLEIAAEAKYYPAVGDNGSHIDAKGSAQVVGRRLIYKGEGVAFFIAPTAGASAAIVIEKNEVTSLDGAIGAEVHDARGALFSCLVAGHWSAETGKLDGEGEVKLARDVVWPEVESGPRVVVKRGSKGRATVDKNKLAGLDGQLSLEVHDERGPLIAVTGSGALSMKGELKKAKGAARLLRPIDIGDGVPLVRIPRVDASAEIKDGKLTEVLGRMDFVLPRLGERFGGTLSGGWAHSHEPNAKPRYWGAGTLRLPLVDDPKHGRSLNGEVGVRVDQSGDWAVSGQLRYQLAKGIGGNVGVRLDQALDPEIDVDLDIKNVALVAARSLFDRKLDLLPKMTIGAGLVSAGFGVSAGLSLAMQSLLASAHISAKNWRPLSQKQTVPDFEAALALSFGLDLRAAIAAYLQLQLGIPSLLSLNAGIEAELGLDMPLRFAPTGKLWGGRSGFGGELDISATLEPKLGLGITPYLGGEVLFFDIGPHRFDTFTFDLGSPLKLSWGTTYGFGDEQKAPRPRSASDNATSAGTVRQVKKSHKAPPSFPSGDKPAPSAAPGMPRVGNEAGLDALGGLGGGEGTSKLSAMMAAIDALGKLGAAAKHYLDISKPSTAMIMNPAAAAKRMKEAWEAVAAEGRLLFKACEGLFGDLKTSVPMWVRIIIEAPPGQTPGLIEAWFDEDDVARQMIAQGVHRSLSLAERVQLVDAMLSGSTGDEDEGAILKVLEDARRRGDLGALVKNVGLDSLKSAIDGDEYDELLALLRKAGLE